MFEEDIEELKAKTICSSCVGEEYLSDQIAAHGNRSQCSYCGETGRTYSVGELAERMETAFEHHYVRTSDQPDSYQYMLLADRESNYDWERDGEPVVYAIMNAADIPEAAAEDVQKILDDEHGDFESAKMGEETEFSSESYYEEKGVGAGHWHDEWDSFERALKTEARFLSRRAADYLSAIFAGIGEMRTRDKRPLVIDAGPETDFSAVYRARVFQSDEKLKVALCRPDTQLGSPPTIFALAGRMNAQGISVFYGANDARVAIAEVRAPVGSQVAVARFEIIRHLRLLDLTALSDVGVGGSVFDVELAGRMERASFLRSLSRRITRPVMPDDEPFEYLVTQAIADFLATEVSVPIDGIIYPSVQVAGHDLNVVLFHKAARVEAMDIPEGTEIDANTGHFGEDGWEDDYAVIEEVPPVPAESNETDGEAPSWPPNLADLATRANLIWENLDTDWRKPGLCVLPDSVRVHRVSRVVFETEEFPVRRHRWEKREPDF